MANPNMDVPKIVSDFIIKHQLELQYLLGHICYDDACHLEKYSKKVAHTCNGLTPGCTPGNRCLTIDGNMKSTRRLCGARSAGLKTFAKKQDRKNESE